MSRSAAQPVSALHGPYDLEPAAPAERFLPLQLAQTAEATGRLINAGLAVRGVTSEGVLGMLTDPAGDLRPEVAPLARAYEAALLAGLSPTEVKTLRRLLTRVEIAAQRLAGDR